MPPPLQITYIGHATLLLEIDGFRLLTDPLLRNRVLHLVRTNPGLEESLYMDIDAILISHLHRDHLDLPSLNKIRKETLLIVPAGAGDFLRKQGYKNTLELTPGECWGLSGISIEAVFARHHGFRVPFGPGAGCLGFLIEGSSSLYFAGDTDLFSEMAHLAGRIDLAFLPVWGWGPTLGDGHLDPYRASQALQLLKPDIAIPIHWGTFYPIGFNHLQPSFLTNPPHDFLQYAGRLASEVQVIILQPGESYCLPGR